MSTPTPSGSDKALGLLKQYWAPLLIIVLVLVFVLQNTQRTRVTIIGWHVSPPLWLLIAAVALLGVVVGWFIGRRRKP